MILQANIGGYSGRTATVIGFLDINTQTLYIERADKMNSNRFKNAGLITNQPILDYDYFFTEADFKQAFYAYRFYNNSDRLILKKEAQRAMPPLQVDKITENGTNLAIFGDITNEQMGVVALCLFAQMTSQYQSAIEAYENDDNDIDILTI